MDNTFSSPFTFSQSSLQDYVDCPRRFQLRYIEQFHWPAVESAPVLENEQRQIEGQNFHRLLQQFFIGLPAEKLTPFTSTENLRRWWDNFMTDPPQVADHSLYTELTLSTPIENHLIVAKYDLVAVNPRRSAIIYDWKTYRRRPGNPWLANRMQTKIYQSLLFKSGKHLNNDQPFTSEKAEMIYWFADFPEEPAKFSFDESKVRNTWNELKQLVKEIVAKQSFPMTDDEKLCGYCVFRSYCERGIKASDGEALGTGPAIDNFSYDQIQETEF
jgi:PD-(D/E)XK nuclease superfamily